jgi:hypothetical protein
MNPISLRFRQTKMNESPGKFAHGVREGVRSFGKIALFVLIVAAGVAYGGPFFRFGGFVLSSLFPKHAWAYALRYDTTDSHVSITPEPTDCNFWYAPIGFKGCHYKRVIRVTIYSTRSVTDGQSFASGRMVPMASDDDGKTWFAIDALPPSGLSDVYVDWERIDGE